MNKRNKIIGIIPARFGSTRFPGKPLADINGKSMIERVYLQSKKALLIEEIIVATDDERIEKHVNDFGGKVVMTSAEHQSGTDRCVEAIKKTAGNYDIVINIQGDEPLIFPGQIDQLAQCFENEKTSIATLIKIIGHEEELNNPNVVKVLMNIKNQALYFSRAALPYNRNKATGQWLGDIKYYKHVGIYGYRTDTLIKIAALPQSPLELTEALEQLRWLENGYEITTALTGYENISVDSPEDIANVIKRINSMK